MVEAYIMPIALVTIIGILAGLVLAIASKVMYVHVDETVVQLREALPGANCGACGYAGCDEYAKKLAADKTIKTNLCTPGGEGCAQELSQILGVEFEGIKPQFALIKCSGDCDHTGYKMDYQGIQTCFASKSFFGGRGKCSSACMGFGDCAVACPYGAIHMANGVAVVDRQSCIGCGVCVEKCPNHLIDIIPSDSKVFIGCSSHEKGAAKRKACSAGCIACKKCEKICPSEAITIENNLASIDPEKCTNCGACIEVCPTKVIRTY